MFLMIPHSQPYFDLDDEKALREVLRRRFVTHGEEAKRLGELGASALCKSWGIAVQSGTDALIASLLLLGIGEGAKVAVPSYICSAVLDALAFVKAVPVCVDVERDTLGLDPALLEKTGPVDATLAAHLFGLPARIWKIPSGNVIEDCAQTLGVSAGGKPVGSRGKLSVCSFYGTKLLAAGHGGLIAGDNAELEKEAWRLFLHDKQDKWRFHLHCLMSDLTASVGCSQFLKLKELISERRGIAERFLEALNADHMPSECSYSRFIVTSENAGAAIARFNAAGIEAKRPVYKPLYTLCGLEPEDYPVAKWAHDHVISVPIYPGMAEENIMHIEAFLREHKHVLRCWPPA